MYIFYFAGCPPQLRRSCCIYTQHVVFFYICHMFIYFIYGSTFERVNNLSSVCCGVAASPPPPTIVISIIIIPPHSFTLIAFTRKLLYFFFPSLFPLFIIVILFYVIVVKSLKVPNKMSTIQIVLKLMFLLNKMNRSA